QVSDVRLGLHLPAPIGGCHEPGGCRLAGSLIGTSVQQSRDCCTGRYAKTAPIAAVGVGGPQRRASKTAGHTTTTHKRVTELLPLLSRLARVQPLEPSVRPTPACAGDGRNGVAVPSRGVAVAPRFAPSGS